MEAAEAGIPWIQLRDHSAEERAFRKAASDLVPRLQAVAPDLLISINARLSIALGLKTAFHTGLKGPTIDEAIRRGVSRPIGYSVHSVEEARAIARLGVDYLIFSPVYKTRSKPEVLPQGIEALRQVVGAVAPVPVIALGGITASNVSSCIQAGAEGVAVLSFVMNADNIADSIHELTNHLM